MRSLIERSIKQTSSRGTWAALQMLYCVTLACFDGVCCFAYAEVHRAIPPLTFCLAEAIEGTINQVL